MMDMADISLCSTAGREIQITEIQGKIEFIFELSTFVSMHTDTMWILAGNR